MPKAIESPPVTLSLSSAIPVTIADPVAIEYPGPALFLEGTAASTPGAPQTLISQIVPLAVTWKLRRIEVVSRAYSEFRVKINGTTIKEGKTSPAEATLSLPFDPWSRGLNPDVIDVTFEQSVGPVVPVTARLYYTEE